MTTTQTTEALIASAIQDAARMPEGATIYPDPNVGGFSWTISGTDQSGSIGNEADDYSPEGWYSEDGQEIADQVAAALADAGYEVVA